MMNLSFNIGLLCCAMLFGTILVLYFMDSEEFLYRISDKLFRIWFWYSRHYGRLHRQSKNKYHTLGVAQRACWEAVTKYIVRTNLKKLDKDETLLKLLELHKKIDTLDKKEEDDFSLKEVKDLLNEVTDTYDTTMVELEEKYNISLDNVSGKYFFEEKS